VGMESGTGLLDAVRALCPKIAAQAQETEDRGSIAPELYDEIVATGFFRALIPAAYGGLELPFADVNQMIIEGARADGSVGWLMMIAVDFGFITGMYSLETVNELFAHGPDLRVRGAIAPKGVAVATAGGYSVSGRWPFASGGPEPQLVAGHCVVVDGESPRIGPSGIPEMVLALMDAAQVEFLDTWHVLGFKGTDSRDFVAREVFVPQRRTMNVFASTPCFDTPPCRLPIRVALAPGHAAVAVGIAQGALDDIANLALTKRAAMNPESRLAEDPVFQHLLGEQVLRLAAARALLDRETAVAWDAGVAQRSLTPIETLQIRSMAGYVTAECVKVVDAAYTLAGSTSLYESSSLQRRLRDIHVATQHVAAGTEGYRRLGALIAGEQVPAMALF
jgi:alkylation response protein AidB-like acyl-CoA dehydrogenase